MLDEAWILEYGSFKLYYPILKGDFGIPMLWWLDILIEEVYGGLWMPEPNLDPSYYRDFGPDGPPAVLFKFYDLSPGLAAYRC